MTNFVRVSAWWWKCAAIVPLSVLGFGCNRGAESARPVPAAGQQNPLRARVVEPRLTGFDGWQRCTSETPAGHVVQDTRCGEPNIPPDLVSIAVGECNRMMNTESDAVRLLAYVPHCTDAAVEKLAVLARPRRDAKTMSDLAAAYYVRAQRKDQPSDLVRSLEAAEQAVRLAPAMAEARFNRTLAQEALGFSAEALQSWDALRKERPQGWVTEAEQHWSRLAKQRALSAAVQWPLNEQRLPEVARANDRAAVTQLVAPYRAAAHRYVEDEVLGDWALAASEGRTNEAEERLELAQMIALSLAQLSGDRYLLESVELIRSSRAPHRLAALQQGHLALRRARRAERRLSSENAGDQYRAAGRAFAAAGSPMRFGAALGCATALTFAREDDRAMHLLRSIEGEARRKSYPYLLARVHTGRGFLFTIQGRYLDALAEYSEAEVIFETTADNENLSNVYARKIGLFRTVGHEELTWREAFKAWRHAASVFAPQSRHMLLGESALSAVALGYPSVALRYQNIAVRLSENELARGTDPANIASSRANLGVAFRTRAGIRVRLRDYAGAQADLNTAIPLIGERAGPEDAAILSGFRARLAEIEAQTLAETNRKRAIASLSVAIEHAERTHYRTLTASLLMQRAEMQRLEGSRTAALHDLRTAIAALRAEEQAMLLGRGRVQPAAELLWSGYFARPREAYLRLIRQLVEDGSDAEAFEYAEKARGYEPLHLVLNRERVPAEFRARIRNGEPYRLEDVQEVLPSGTFLLQYCVLEDITYVWIVWKGNSERRTLRIGENAIAEVTEALQRFASQRDGVSFENALAAPYEALFKEPIARIAKLQKPGVPAKLVVIPDSSMHGLPFAALRNGKRFLVQEYPVSAAASATLYAFSLAKDRQLSTSKPETVLLVADPAFNPRLGIAHGLSPLRTALSEAVRIERHYEPVVKIERLLRTQATVPAFLRLARRSAVVHVAAHGIANPDTPSRSFLLFAPAENDSGALDAERLLNELRLDRTRLFVLSACSTAGGIPVGPEGLAPLVRPLVAAGVPGVVGTLWNVGDNAATEELLVRFHQHYRDGHDADDALRLAQLDMLGDPDLERRSAWAWAPFQMVGYASSPFTATAVHTRRKE